MSSSEKTTPSAQLYSYHVKPRAGTPPTIADFKISTLTGFNDLLKLLNISDFISSGVNLRIQFSFSVINVILIQRFLICQDISEINHFVMLASRIASITRITLNEESMIDCSSSLLLFSSASASFLAVISCTTFIKLITFTFFIPFKYPASYA